MEVRGEPEVKTEKAEGSQTALASIRRRAPGQRWRTPGLGDPAGRVGAAGEGGLGQPWPPLLGPLLGTRWALRVAAAAGSPRL